jgi:hypothetical protein
MVLSVAGSRLKSGVSQKQTYQLRQVLKTVQKHDLLVKKILRSLYSDCTLLVCDNIQPYRWIPTSRTQPSYSETSISTRHQRVLINRHWTRNCARKFRYIYIPITLQEMKDNIRTDTGLFRDCLRQKAEWLGNGLEFPADEDTVCDSCLAQVHDWRHSLYRCDGVFKQITRLQEIIRWNFC